MSMENRRGSIFTPNADLTSLFIPQGEDPEANFCETFLEALYDAQVIKDIEAEVEGLRSSVSEKMDSQCVSSSNHLSPILRGSKGGSRDENAAPEVPYCKGLDGFDLVRCFA